MRHIQLRQELVIYTFCTQTQLVLSVQELEVEVSCANADTFDIKLGNIDVAWVWDDWKEMFVTNMGGTTCVDGVRHKYIKHAIKPQVWVLAHDAKTDEERLIYLVPPHSTRYGTNNRTVWHDI